MQAAWLRWPSRRTRWIVVGIAVVLWVAITYFMPVVGPDDRPAIVLGIGLLTVIIGGVIAEVFVTVRQLLDRRQGE
ncbi:MAG TPA: hypothetical protein VJ597_05885 [Sphingomicrobium sp.]|nr:hypothetical protein [Sphingomicrobium sp.]